MEEVAKDAQKEQKDYMYKQFQDLVDECFDNDLPMVIVTADEAIKINSNISPLYAQMLVYKAHDILIDDQLNQLH